MRYFSAISGAIGACLIASAGVAVAPEPESASKAAKAIVELFTSQGCSSCVAADAYFAELAKRDDVVALSLHVDYWDYLGWRDTLGDPANTERQRDYAAVHGSRRIYTPQMIVNGGADYVGSDRDAVETAIANATLPVPVTMRRGDGTVEIEVGALPQPSGTATIRLVLLTTEAEVEIPRGENAGSKIDYYNVVRAIRPVGMWNGDTVRITLPQHEIMSEGINGCAIVVQEDRADGLGAIIGASWLGDW